MRKVFPKYSVLLLAASSALAATGVQAQGRAEPVCTAAELPLEEGGEPYLRVSCGRMAVALGRVESYQLVQLPSLRSALVVTRSTGMRRAWLVMDNGDEGIALEEITGTITKLSGRGGQRDLSDLTLEYDDINRGQLTAAIRRPNGELASLDLGAMVTRSREVAKQSKKAGGE